MNLIIWLAVGGRAWLGASVIMGSDARQGILLNIVVGITGAVIGGWLLSPLVGVATINQRDFSLPSLLVSLAGAVVLLAIVKFVRRGA